MWGFQCRAAIEHEIFIAEAELLLNTIFKRSVVVGKAVADGYFVRDGIRYYVEVDNSEHMNARQMRGKWAAYPVRLKDAFILVICHTKGRLRRLLKTAGQVKDFALFTRFRWLIGKREPWIDGFGRWVKI